MEEPFGTMSKLAVIFPGIGYHTDKPLLYFGKKLARNISKKGSKGIRKR